VPSLVRGVWPRSWVQTNLTLIIHGPQRISPASSERTRSSLLDICEYAFLADSCGRSDLTDAFHNLLAGS
jgi:hypothetical protein